MNSNWQRAWPQGWTVEHVGETGSTNADLLATVAARPDRSVLVADHQTAGRGRLDRGWDAPPGTNLLVSLLFRGRSGGAHEPVRRLSVAALGAARAVAPGAGMMALKWPNDLLADGRKLAGVLAQGNPAGDVVVGIGLNVAWAPPGAARLGAGIDRSELLARILAAFDALPADPDAFHARYRSELATLGQAVRVERPAGDLVGRAVDVDRDGALVVLDECAITHRVNAGDITHLRQ